MVVICVARRYIHLYTDDSLLFKKQSENSLVCYMFHEKKNDWITCIELRIYKRERERKEREREYNWYFKTTACVFKCIYRRLD